MVFFKSRFEKALKRILEEDEQVPRDPKRRTLSSAKDVRLLQDAINQTYQIDAPTGKPSFKFKSLLRLAGEVSGEQARTAMQRDLIPLLVKVFDEQLHESAWQEEALMLILHSIIISHYREGLTRLITASHASGCEDRYWWSTLLRHFEGEHPHTNWLVDQLRDPIPEGFAGVSYLDLVNRLCREDRITDHPFNNANGRDRLERFLLCKRPQEYSYAVSAVVSLPFVQDPGGSLMKLAKAHPDPHVRLESAWASGVLGREDAWEDLIHFCKDANWSKLATTYLEELGRAHLIPEEAEEPEFKAKAELTAWLAHPMEFGRFPDSIELYDHRKIYWPPTDDRRSLWLFKYSYADGKPKEGIGLVGSITFALFGVSTAKMPAEDILGLHCCWELENKGDPRTPKQRNPAAGRALLARYNESISC